LKKFLPPSSGTGSIIFDGSLFNSKPSKYGCFNAYAGVILFCGSKIIIFCIISIASSEAFGINYCSYVGTNLGNLKPIFDAS
jgi:hypothetical protein